MPTTETWTVKASGGDYTTLAAALAAKVTGRDLVADDVVVRIELYTNTLESVTVGTGTTTDATRYVVICGGAYGAADSYKHRGRPWGAAASVIGGACLSLVTGLVLKLYDLTLTAEGGSSACIRVGGTAVVSVTVVRCQFTSSRHWGLLDDSTGASTYTFESCLFWRSIAGPSTTAGVWLNTGSAATVTMFNCSIYGGQYGLRRVAGTLNATNVYALASGTADYNGTISKTTCASEDGTGGTTVSEAAYARAVSRLSSMLAAGTMDDAPSEAPGKAARLALYRLAGTRLGVLSGDAAIASGVLTGTTGAYSLADAEATLTSLTSMCIGCKATLPASAVSRGLMTIKRASGNINRASLSVGSSGDLIFQVWDNAGSQVPAGSVLAYTPSAGELDGTHVFAGRIHGGTLYVYLDGVEKASGAYAGTRDASDSLAVWVGSTSNTHLGAGASLSSWAITTGAAVPPDLPLPYYSDGAGMLDLFALTPLSSATLKTGGTVAGAPTRDIEGLPLADRRCFDEAAGHSIGAHGWHPTATPGGDQLSTTADIAGDVVALPGPVLS